MGEMLVSPPRLPCSALLVFAARSRAGVVTGGGDGEAPDCGKDGWLVVWGPLSFKTRGRRSIGNSTERVGTKWRSKQTQTQELGRI